MSQHDAEETLHTGTPADFAFAVRTCLAPLKLQHVFDAAIGYVLHGTGSQVLAALDALRYTQGGKMVWARGIAWTDDDIAAVASLQPGWSPQAANTALLVVYRDAPPDVLARFGRLLGAISVPDGRSSTLWLATLTDDVMKATTSRSEASREVRTRWTPDLVSEIARAGRAPGQTPVHATLETLLHFDSGRDEGNRHEILATDTGDAFLARHTDVFTEVLIAASRSHNRFGYRRFALLRCGRNAERHAGLLAAMAVDEDHGVRNEALGGLAWLEEAKQVELLRPHLRTAAPDRLAGVLERLTDIDGGLAAIEDALTATEGEPLEEKRAQLLRRAAERASLTREPVALLPVPPTAAPTDPDLLAELATRPAAARLEGYHFWPGVVQWLPRIPDVRALRDALRKAGMTDADRRTASLLTTQETHIYGPKIGAVLTTEDAGRWWPLFAERPDLVVEYLDGIVCERDAYDVTVDTTGIMLKILECFPAVPPPLVPRLISIGLGTSWHRLAARRVLGDHPGAQAAAQTALNGAEATARASAAEWLIDRGEPGILPPEPGWQFGDGVLSPATQNLPDATLRRLDRFRQQALGRGVPAQDVNRWLGLARPTLQTAPHGTGLVVGRLGGPLMLPPGAPTPSSYDGFKDEHFHDDHQLIATIDLSAIPEGATDLPLPPDGMLLLFANPDLDATELEGGAVYVPAGVPVEERASTPDYEIFQFDTPEELDAKLRDIGDLWLTPGVSLPSIPPDDDMLDRHPHANTLREIWSAQADGDGEWQMGGHAANYDDFGDPVTDSADPELGEPFSDPADWVLLAQWAGVPMAIVYWTITRQDLAARRFDRVAVHMFANP
ncbi:DUF1963 domain-containing protein [Streptomyces marokkonensis]|uniref:DUF1963 domain-containing protein n=1 Tax=Streptomyces marokkonensis TaxID=324855 RepID=A0ABW6QCQ8_9ACTN